MAIGKSEINNIKRGRGRPRKKSSETSLRVTFKISQKQTHPSEFDSQVREVLLQLPTPWPKRKRSGRNFMKFSPPSFSSSSSSSSDISPGWPQDTVIPEVMKSNRGRPPKSAYNNNSTSLLSSFSIVKKQRSAKLYSPPPDFDQQIREEICPGWAKKLERRQRGRPRKFSSTTSSTTSSSSSSYCLSNNSLAWHMDDIVIPGPIPNLDEIIGDSSLFVNFFSDIPEIVS